MLSRLRVAEEEETPIRSSLQKKRRPSDRLFQETMKPSDRLRLALAAAAGGEATGTQREQAQAGGGFRNEGGEIRGEPDTYSRGQPAGAAGEAEAR